LERTSTRASFFRFEGARGFEPERVRS